MALTFPRWMAAAVVGCAILVVAVLQDSRSRSRFQLTPREALDRRRGFARQGLNHAAEQLHVLALRDSLSARRNGATIASGKLFIDAAFDAGYRQFFTALASRGSSDGATAAKPAAVLPIDFAFVLDTGGLAVSAFTPTVGQAALQSRVSFPGYWSIDYILPAAGGAERCLVIVRFDARLNGSHQGRASLAANANLAGPCAYYRAFGMPGAVLDRWLRARGWTLGERTAWNRAPAALRYDRWPSYASSFETYPGHEARRALSRSWVRCQAGDLAICEHTVLASPSGTPAAWSDGIVSTHLSYTNSFEKYVLSEMVRTLGPERFGNFWRSSQDPTAAFAAATGTSLGQWTNDLVRRAYGDQHLGPGIETAGLGIGALLVVLGIGVGASMAGRRTVG